MQSWEDIADHGISAGVHRIKRIKRERKYKVVTNSSGYTSDKNK
jgi:hypothetical protein